MLHLISQHTGKLFANVPDMSLHSVKIQSGLREVIIILLHSHEEMHNAKTITK